MSALSPAAFAVDSANDSASPSPASPNTTINLASAVSVDATSASTGLAHSESILYLVVEAPSGTIYACTSGTACNPSYQSGATPGTGTCSVPFGGTSTLSETITGGVTETGTCSGSNAAAWGPLSGFGCSNDPCSGSGDFSALLSSCSGSVTDVFLSIPFSTTHGDTSESGTYNVLTCWSMSVTGTFGLSFVARAQTTFVITPSTGVPQFPLGMAALFALMVPLLLITRKWGPALKLASV